MSQGIKKSIAILGATSHIAKGLIYNFSRAVEYKDLYLFARSKSNLGLFLKQIKCSYLYQRKGFSDFSKHHYDVIINCVGLGTPVKVRGASEDLFKLTEEFDNMVLKYLQRHPDTIYINFSSGAVYGTTFTHMVDNDSRLNIMVNNIKPENYYGIAKLYSEVKHRALKNLKIVDLRIFSYFSRFIDLDSGYFLTELIKSIKKKKVFITSPCDFIRDILSQQDLFDLIRLIIKSKPFNGAFDAYSSKPVSKFELLDYFVKNYSLKFIPDDKFDSTCPTGKKQFYCSGSRTASRLGYHPKFSSLGNVANEAAYLLGSQND